MANNNLNEAKFNKKDEFYTLYSDIEFELKNYSNHFTDKVIYCNCDNPEFSNFWKYFYNNFHNLKLKLLVSTYYDTDNNSYKTEYNGTKITKTKLNNNGDFRSEECTYILTQADIVVTNPPFSLFRKFLDVLINYNKKFIIWGNVNALTYKNVFFNIMNNKLWLGYLCNKTCKFIVPDDYEKYDSKYTESINDGHKYASVAFVTVFTNLDISKRHSELDLTSEFDGDIYCKFDNYNAINVDKVVDIPNNYSGIIGVPVTYLIKHNPDKFDIVGCSAYDDTSCRIDRDYKKLCVKFLKSDGIIESNSGSLRDRVSPKVYRKGKSDYSVLKDGRFLSTTYARIFIKRKDI